MLGPQRRESFGHSLDRCDELAQRDPVMYDRIGAEAASSAFERKKRPAVIVTSGVEQSHRDLEDALVEPAVSWSGLLPERFERLVTLEELALVELLNCALQLSGRR